MFEGKTAFVTGAASGIGRSLAVALADRGCGLALSDYKSEGLAETRDLLADKGVPVATFEGDVAEAGTVTRLAEAAISRMGNIHHVFNNAGVALSMPGGKTAMEDWRWVVDINLMAVAEGVEAFLPHIKAHGEGGHICNTASMAGHGGAPGMGPYCATKFAVVGYTECLAQELAKSETISASVLCPAWVKTNINNTFLDRPSARHLENKIPNKEAFDFMTHVIETGLDPDKVAHWTLESIAAGRLYIFTHPEMYDAIEMRKALIDRDYQACKDWWGAKG